MAILTQLILGQGGRLYTTVSFASADHFVLDLSSPAAFSPRAIACLRQVYRVTSDIPSCRDDSATDRGWGNIFFITATLRSGE
jgi:hypothetical protein